MPFQLLIEILDSDWWGQKYSFRCYARFFVTQTKDLVLNLPGAGLQVQSWFPWLKLLLLLKMMTVLSSWETLQRRCCKRLPLVLICLRARILLQYGNSTICIIGPRAASAIIHNSPDFWRESFVHPSWFCFQSACMKSWSNSQISIYVNNGRLCHDIPHFYGENPQGSPQLEDECWRASYYGNRFCKNQFAFDFL